MPEGHLILFFLSGFFIFFRAFLRFLRDTSSSFSKNQLRYSTTRILRGIVEDSGTGSVSLSGALDMMTEEIVGNKMEAAGTGDYPDCSIPAGEDVRVGYFSMIKIPEPPAEA